MASNNDRGGAVFSEINITPLTDIFLVLLIIFMVTTAVTIESAAHVDLPKAEAAATPNDKQKSVIVTLTGEHQILVNHINFFFLMIRRPPKATLFTYTALV